jgi:hypothetical protein
MPMSPDRLSVYRDTSDEIGVQLEFAMHIQVAPRRASSSGHAPWAQPRSTTRHSLSGQWTKSQTVWMMQRTRGELSNSICDIRLPRPIYNGSNSTWRLRPREGSLHWAAEEPGCGALLKAADAFLI